MVYPLLESADVMSAIKLVETMLLKVPMKGFAQFEDLEWCRASSLGA